MPLLSLILFACSTGEPVSSEGGPDDDAGIDGPNLDAGTDAGGGRGLDGGADGGGGLDGGLPCVNSVEQIAYGPPPECRVHIPEEVPPVYVHNPPVIGEHFPVWARWKKFNDEVPRGYWVHNLEHGGVVFLYRPDAAQSIKDALNRVYDAIPPEPDCVQQGLTHNRVVLTPDSSLDVPWAVTVSGPESDYCVGFGYRIKANCIASEQALVDFALQHRNRAIETFCDDGFYDQP